MRNVGGALIVLFVATALATADAQRLPVLNSWPYLSIVNARVVNVRDGSVSSFVTIVVRNGRIESVGQSKSAPNSQVVDVKGHYVLPGLIDAHVHISDIDSGVRALKSGATTIRSAGVAGYADVALRELAKQAAVAVPDMIAAGYGLRPQLGFDAFLSSPEDWDLESGVRGTERIRRAVRMNVRRRVDWIKIFVTEGLANDPRRLLFTEAEIRAAVQEAARQGIPVEAHAFGDEGVAAAIRAGVRSIEHGSYVTDATLALMKEKAAFLVPTIRILTATPESAPTTVRGRVTETLPLARRSTLAAVKIGVKVVAGTDSRYAADTERFVTDEIRELAALGFSPLEALQSATLFGAEMLRLESQIGAIAPGYEADLIALAGNPLADVTVLANPPFVLSNGRIAVNKIAPNP
jgi:imidazolonepropionase-like amidohydrolase